MSNHPFELRRSTTQNSASPVKFKFKLQRCVEPHVNNAIDIWFLFYICTRWIISHRTSHNMSSNIIPFVPYVETPTAVPMVAPAMTPVVTQVAAQVVGALVIEMINGVEVIVID